MTTKKRYITNSASVLIRPKKSLGQNWLVNPHILDKIVSAAEVSKDDIILEVGPGTGNLTEKLAQALQQSSGQKAGMVIAIEKDRRLIPDLKEKFKNQFNVKIVEADVLNLDVGVLIENCKLKIEKSHYKIVGNIPYYITSNLLRTIFESANWRRVRPELIILTIQKEVAQRIMAKPPHMNLLALSVQYYSKPEIIGYVSKNNFRPVPKVDSAIIRLTPKPPEVKPQRFPGVRPRELFGLMKMSFSEKRKQLASVLSKKLKLPKEKILDAFQKEGINSTARAENLSIEQWQKLAESL